MNGVVCIRFGGDEVGMASFTGSSSAGSSSEAEGSIDIENLKRKSDDVGWEYGVLAVQNNPDKIKCKLCSKIVSGGINRLKKHIAHIKGNVASCPKATSLDKARCKESCEAPKQKKERKRIQLEAIREEVVISQKDNDDEDNIEVEGCSKRARSLGPMDKFCNPISSMDSSEDLYKKTRQQNINDALFKSRSHEVHAYLARWVYESGIPFNAINNDSFRQFVDAVGQFGLGYIPPSQYQLREPLLKQEVERTKQSMKVQEEEWKNSGCSLMTDAWSDGKRRSIMNMCVNSRFGTVFISSIESSSDAHTGKFIFEYVDKSIEEVGANNVIQVVTDNASNNLVAAKLLKLKRPNIFWTPCATHTLNLALEGIGKTQKFKVVIDAAKSFTTFIYAHHKTLAMMRKFTKQRDIVRLGVTRFASSFLTMQSILEKQESLKCMFVSKEWNDCKWSSTPKGLKAYSTIVSPNFWPSLSACVDIFKPLITVLRLVDGNYKPAMGFVYGELKDARKEIIKVCKGVRETYQPILDIIDSKVKDRLDSPLHLGGYLLNPFYYYRDDEVQKDPKCMSAILTCIEMFFPHDLDIQNLVSNVELLDYKEMKGMFGRKLAIMGRMRNDEVFNPVGWWSNYGSETPYLQMMAMKILSLTTSSSGCERNWSTFEGIHTKKRNRLDVERMSHLVYVQFNAKLVNKVKRARNKQDILLANDASMAQSWIIDGPEEDEVDQYSPNINLQRDEVEQLTQPFQVSRASRELGEDDFQSDDEEGNTEFTFEDVDPFVDCW